MRENIRKILNEAEKIYIYIYDSFNNGYNETTGGDSLGGRKWTQEQKEHMKHVMTGKKRPKDYIDPRSKPVYLYNHITGKYFYIPGAKFVYTIDGQLCGKDVLACASGRQVSTKGYVCAYSKEELEYKIQNTKFGKRCRLK